MIKPEISIVVPLYNEAKTFEFLIERLNNVKKNEDLSIEVVLVDDGSTDETTSLMQQIALLDAAYTSVFLSRNYGHQIALSAGLKEARATEAVFIIDGDLQDPPELLSAFYKKMKEGYDIVYAVRKKRKEKFLKRILYYLFYRIQKLVVKIDIPLDSGDFSMLSRKVVDVLNQMPEESKYIRGQRAWIGLKQCGIEYERDERKFGDSKYSFSMLLQLAYNGIFNFTELPIKLITRLGVLAILISFLYFCLTLFKLLMYDDVPEGFTGLLFTIILFSGVQLISIGILGQYLVRVFFQTKGRPLYIVKSKIANKVHMDG
ncbi:glycosyltransferase family 2 protein [Flavobacteriaceae bacterium MHTCC 0001]